MSAPPEFFVRNALALAAFVVVLCECVNNLKDETRLIWRRPVTWVKGVYVLARYSVLAASVINVFFIFCGPLKSFPNQQDDCRTWFSILAIVSYIQTLAIDGFSAIRIFALYSPESSIGIMSASLIITEVVLVSTSSADAMLSCTYTSTCRVISTPRQVIVFSCWLAVTQVSLIGLTLYKRFSILTDPQQNSPTVDLVLLQGMYLCLLILVLTTGSLTAGLLTGTADPNLFAIWPSVLTSSALCRVILNLRRSALRRHVFKHVEERSKLDIQFTSWLSSPGEEDEQAIRLDDRSGVLRRRPCAVTDFSDEYDSPALAGHHTGISLGPSKW